MTQPILLIHGGASNLVPNPRVAAAIQESLEKILRESYKILAKGGSARDAAVKAVELLENDPLYNAGYGSKLQSDGVIRMSAGLMSSDEQKFAGVVNVEQVKNPIRLAEALVRERDRVLAGTGALEHAKKRGIALGDNYTEARRREFARKNKGKTGTVGAVALDKRGRLAAATSTGGKGHEAPGRVSDTPTVAGTYANTFAAVSATGVGEEIMAHAVAARIVTRAEDGMKLKAALEKSLKDGKSAKAQFGCITISAKGETAAATTTKFMAWGCFDGERLFTSPEELSASRRRSARPSA